MFGMNTPTRVVRYDQERVGLAALVGKALMMGLGLLDPMRHDRTGLVIGEMLCQTR